MKNTVLKNTAERIIGHLTVLFVWTALLAGASVATTLAQGPIVNSVHAGGHDVEDPDIPGSEPGFDKNYSLVAFKLVDGTARGKLVDRYAGGGGLGLKAD